MRIGRIRKALTPLVTGGIGWATMVVNSTPAGITASEWIVAATVAATSLGVYAISNDPPAA